MIRICLIAAWRALHLAPDVSRAQSGSYCTPLLDLGYCHLVGIAVFRRFSSKRHRVSHAFHVQGSQGGILPPNIPLDMGGLMSGHMAGHLLRHLDPVLSGGLAGNPDEVLYGYLDPHLNPVRCGNPDRVLSRIPVPYPVGVMVGIISPVTGPHQGRHLPRNQGGIQGGLEFRPNRTPNRTTAEALGLTRGGVLVVFCGWRTSLCLPQ